MELKLMFIITAPSNESFLVFFCKLLFLVFVYLFNYVCLGFQNI